MRRPDPCTLLARRASRICDPLARLRYLRAGVQHPSPPPPLTLPRTPSPASAFAFSILIMLTLLALPTVSDTTTTLARLPAPHSASLASPAAAEVWPVETTEDFETYSNGLRIENRFSVSGEARGAYLAFSAQNPSPSNAISLSTPAGIVFHTTESDLVPFDSSENRTLQRVATDTLEFVRRHRSYHFVIDRFGRAFRIVAESSVAFHAGESAWADPQYLYLDLNRAFLGVAFETRTQRGGDTSSVTAAQLATGKALTEMLRSRYRIPASNCVTHALVSLNPSRFLIGWHTDFAANFPFVASGLPDNYAAPQAAISALGFTYDASYLRATGPRLAPGLAAAENRFREAAAALIYRRTAIARSSTAATVRSSPPLATIPPERNPLMKNNANSSPLGLDVGTSRICLARRYDGHVQFESQLNAFVNIPRSPMTEGVLKKERIPHTVSGNMLVVHGNESENMAELLGLEMHRTMSKGMLNPVEPESLTMIRHLISTLAGDPASAEGSPEAKSGGNKKVCYTVPAAPLGASESLTYHEATLQQILTALGFEAHPVNEGLAVVYSELEASNYTGIGVSCGAGLCNVCLAYLAIPVFSFSIPKPAITSIPTPPPSPANAPITSA